MSLIALHFSRVLFELFGALNVVMASVAVDVIFSTGAQNICFQHSQSSRLVADVPQSVD